LRNTWKVCIYCAAIIKPRYLTGSSVFLKLKMLQCQAFNCVNKSGCGKSFFPIPDPLKSYDHRKLCKKWIKNLHNKKLNLQTFKAHRQKVVCRDHFTDDCFEGAYTSKVAQSLNFKSKRKGLVFGSVPTIVNVNNHSSLKKTTKNRPSIENIRLKRLKAQVNYLLANYMNSYLVLTLISLNGHFHINILYKATRIFNIGRKEKDVQNSILPSIHISSFIIIFFVLFALSRDPVLWTDRLTDWRTDGQTEGKPKVPSGKPVGD
jgi:hypothetical protein